MAGLYPIFLNVAGRDCIVVGGGRVAERKVAGLLSAGAKVAVISPQVTKRLKELHAMNLIEIRPRTYQEGDLAGAALVFAATDQEAVNLAVCREAERRGLWVNDAMNPERSAFHIPAAHTSGDLQIAVSTSGTSPTLARNVRDELAEIYDERYERFAALMGRLRERLQTSDIPDKLKRSLYRRCIEQKEQIMRQLDDDYSEQSMAKLVHRLLNSMDTEKIETDETTEMDGN